MPSEVIIDGVKYVPESDISDVQKQLDELVEDYNIFSEQSAQQVAYLEDMLRVEAVGKEERASALLQEAQLIRDMLIEDSPPPPEGDVVIVLESESLMDAIKRSDPGDVIDGQGRTYFEQLDLYGGVANGRTIQNAHVSGFFEAAWEWSYNGDWHEGVYPGIPKLWQQQDSASPHNTERGYPVLCCIGDEPLMWKGNPDIEPGEFYMSTEPTESGTIRVILKEGQSIEDFKIARFPYLLRADEQAENITLKNMTFKGCSNTGFTGAVSLPGEGWKLEDVTVSLVNTIGIEFGQGGEKANMRSQLLNSTLINVAAIDCGQMGFWGSARDVLLQNCGHIRSNWKGFDFAWHASHKFEDTHYCTFMNWYAKDCNGTGFWLDGVNGGNTFNTIVEPQIENCVRAGIEIELGTSSNTITGGFIKTIVAKESPDQDKSGWAIQQSAGIVIKGFSDSNSVTGTHIENCEKAVWIDNEDARGPSKNNTINITTKDIKDMDYLLLGEAHGNKFNED